MIAPVELFLFDLDDPPPEEAPGWLAPAERERANRFATVLLRRRYTAGRAMLRRLLAHDAPAFNLGHGGRHALVAIGPAGMRIGVDIEELRAVVDLETLVPTCLTLPERAEFEAIADEASRREAFLRLWVRKEACLK